MRSLRITLLLGLSSLTATSQSDLTIVRTTDLRSDTHHVQGIDFDELHVWVTSVDKTLRKGYLQEFSLTTGEQLRSVNVELGDRFHPGGISAVGEAESPPSASPSGSPSRNTGATAAASYRREASVPSNWSTSLMWPTISAVSPRHPAF
jgi:hypothetical protein